MVAEFLILEPNFPRSILHCLDRAWNFLRRIRPEQEGPIGMRSADLLGKLVEEVRTHDIDRILSSGLHRELTRLIQATTEVCEAVDVDYFDPPLRIDKPIRRSKAGA